MDDFEKSNREKKLEKFLSQLKTQKQYDIEINNNVKKWKEKYKKQLEDYEFVRNTEELYQVKIGGYIRYINLNEKLKWGGILLKVFKDKDRNLMVLGNKDFKRFIVSFERNYIFYKKHKTASDNLRKIFISFLENANNDDE
jgi:hypothetical protein